MIRTWEIVWLGVSFVFALVNLFFLELSREGFVTLNLVALCAQAYFLRRAATEEKTDSYLLLAGTGVSFVTNALLKY